MGLTLPTPKQFPSSKPSPKGLILNHRGPNRVPVVNLNNLLKCNAYHPYGSLLFTMPSPGWGPTPQPSWKPNDGKSIKYIIGTPEMHMAWCIRTTTGRWQWCQACCISDANQTKALPVTVLTVHLIKSFYNQINPVLIEFKAVDIPTTGRWQCC
jgi:hypothetical protein